VRRRSSLEGTPPRAPIKGDAVRRAPPAEFRRCLALAAACAVPCAAADRSPDSSPPSTFEPSEYHQELQEVNLSVSRLFPRPLDLWSAAAP
jgi:hypothetical protein